MTKPVKLNKPSMEPENRKKIGLIDTESEDLEQTLEVLNPQQKALREAALKKFKINKVRGYITDQIEHINPNRQIADSIRFLFDEHGKPPANLPLEDIITERKKIEAQIRWFEALCSALRDEFRKIKEIEDHAIEYSDQIQAKGD